MKSYLILLTMHLCIKTILPAQIPSKLWRDSICQNNLRINYSPEPASASIQTPPLFDFIGNTLIQVFSGIATVKNDTNLSFNTLVNGFGNLSLLTLSPYKIYPFHKNRNIIYYGDFFSLATTTIPNQIGTIDEVNGTIGIGFENNLLLKGELDNLHFAIRHKIGASYGKYPGLLKYPKQKIILYHCFQFRIKSTNGSLVFEFPLAITQLNVNSMVFVSYYQKLN